MGELSDGCATPPPGTTPLGGLTTVDLMGSSWTQWALHVQDVTSGMILPSEVAVNCPQSDIVGVLNHLENLTPVKYCRFCFGVGRKCRCGNVPRQTPSPASGLWTLLTMSYPAMASSTETTASSSVGGVPPLRHLLPGLPPADPATMSYATMASLPEAAAGSSASGVPPLRHPAPGPPPGNPAPMDTLPALMTEDLLATASVGRGGRGRRSTATRPQIPTAPGPHQTRPSSTQQWMPAPGRQKAGQATPYWQQVYPPQHSTGARMATPKTTTTPSTGQGCEEPA